MVKWACEKYDKGSTHTQRELCFEREEGTGVGSRWVGVESLTVLTQDDIIAMGRERSRDKRQRIFEDISFLFGWCYLFCSLYTRAPHFESLSPLDEEECLYTVQYL